MNTSHISRAFFAFALLLLLPIGTHAAPQYTNPLKHQPYVQLGDAPLVGYGSSATDQFQIIWQTMPDVSSTSVDSFEVEYKLSTEPTTWTSAGAISTINTGVSSRVNHYVTITGLQYNTNYDYRVKHIRDGSTLATYSATYKTRLAAGSDTPFTFVAYGDSASGNPPTNFMSVQQAINNINAEFAILLGDNTYTDGTHTEWDLRLDQTINPTAANFIKNKIDYFGWGNHDIVSASGQPALDNYDNPRPVQGVTSPVAAPVGETPEKNYSFDYGNVHFVTIDTNSYTDATRLNRQLTWAKADLQASNAKWKIVFVHFPIVSISFTSTGPNSNYFQKMVTELLAGGADALFVGHAHTYERSFPITGQSGGTVTVADTNDNDYAKGAGLTEIVSGLGGRDFHGGSTTPNWLVFSQTSAARYNRFGATPPVVAYGFTKIDVTSNQLTISQIKASDGSTVDSFTITAGMSATNVQPASLVAGAVGDVTVSFTNSSTIPADGKVRVILPNSLGNGFVANSGATTAVSASTLSGSLSVSTATTSTSTIITLTRSGGSATTNGSQSITLTNIKNPDITGTTGAYTIQTLTSADALVEGSTSVTADTITAGPIASPNVQPASLAASAVGTVAVTLTTTNPIPADGKIVVTFPTTLGSGFTLNSGGSTAVSDITGIDGTLSVGVASNVVTLTRSGGTSFAGGTVSFNLSNIQNPTIGGSTGTYQIKTTNTSNTTIDQNTSVSADTITGGAAAAWWNNSWSNRIKINFDNSAQSSAATSVPVMITLDSSRVNYADILANGADIRFVDADNATPLSYEIEKWDAAGTSTVWVKVPQIDAASNTDYIYMYYTNPAASDAQSPAAVWSNGYAAVYHFAQTSGAYFDSVSGYASNNSDAQVLSSRTSTLLGNAPTFGGTNTHYVTIADSDTFNFTNFTTEAYIKPAGAGTTISSGGQTTIYPIFTKGMGEGETTAADIHFFLGLRNDSLIGVDFEDSLIATNNAPLNGATTLTTNGSTAYYVANAVLAGSGGYTKIFVNGAQDATSNLPVGANNGVTPNTGGTQKVGIGVALTTAGAINGGFNGMIDEVRISSVTRSADWIALQNKSITGTLNTYEAAENISGAATITSASATPASLVVGATGNVTFAFTTSSALPADGKIILTFPTSLGSGFTFNSGSVTTATSTGFTGTFSVNVSGNVVTLTRVGGSSDSAGAKTVTLSNVKNPNVAGATGIYGIETRTTLDATIDQNNAVAGNTIVAGGLYSTNVEPASSAVSSSGNVTITFSTLNPIPADGKIVVTFPTSLGGGFTFNNGGSTTAYSETMGGSLSVGVASNVVTITRSGGLATSAGETESITLTNVRNPGSTGSTGTYQIKTTNSSNATIDEDTAVGADIIASAGAAGSWWNGSWAYRKKISFNNGSIATNLVNFPVRVELSTTTTTYGNFATNGNDIRFIDADGVTELNYEIENWNTASSSNLWVKVPQVDSASTTDYIYMYYGNPGATAVATTTGVWDSNYVAVHHFGSTTAANYTDSTSRGNNSDAVVSVTKSAVAGASGNAATFTGGSGTSYITLPDSTDYDMTSYTIEAYVRQAGTQAGLISTGTGGLTSIAPVVAKGMAEAESQVADIQFFLGVTASTAGSDFENSVATARRVRPSRNPPVSATSSVVTGTWYHLAQRFNYQEISTATSTHNIYKNGAREGSIQTGFRPSVTGTMKVGISVAPKTTGVASGGGFNGTIDEVRISNVARSEGWIQASRLSTSNTYNTIDGEESVGSGALTSTNVEPASLTANATGNVVVSFTTENAIPSDGKIVITLPTSLGTGFTLNSGGSTVVSTSTNIDGSLAVSTASNIITITRSGGTSSAAGAKSITLTNIKNPNATGSTGTYQIKTTNSSNVTIDQDLAVSADTIGLSTMSATNVQPTSLTVSTTTPVTVLFTTTNSIPVNGKIVVTFPTSLGSGFTLGNVAIQGTPTGINGSFTVATSSNVVTITRTGNGNVSTAGAKSLVLTGITTPNTAGSTGVYQIKTTNSSNVTIDEDTAVTADVISGALTSTNVQPASLVAGAVGNIVVSFTPEAAIPADGKIKIVFPTILDGGFIFDSGSLTSVTSASGIDGSFTVATTSDTITITRSGGSSATPGAKTITLTNIKNPTIPGFTGPFTIQTLTSADVVIDQDANVAQDEITAGSLTSTNIEPASLVADAVGNVTVSFTTANPIPEDGRVYVYLPISLGDGYILNSGASTGVTSLSGIDGTVSLSITNNYVNIVRNGDGTVSAPGAKSLVLTNVKNPNIAGSTGLYTIETRTSSAITIDRDLAVTADTITSAGGGDVTAPTITNISSDKANGTYGVGEVIDIDVTFSENVTSTGSVTVTLETGATDRTCTFTVSNSSTSTCNYTVQAGDTSADLTVSSISGTVADQNANAMSNFTPATNLAANKALVIDAAAPVISSVASTTGVTTATTTWTTDETSSSKTYYGTVSGTYTASSTGASATSHTVAITSLSASTLYYFIVVSTDTLGNTATSSEYSFTTQAVPDTTVPVVTNLASSTTATTATVTWDTNESALGQVEYGTTLSYGSSVTSGSYNTAHSFTATGLTPSTAYYFRITAQDGAGNSTTSPAQVFTTAPDTTGPNISSVSISKTQTTASISWITDEHASSSFAYGTTSNTYTVVSTSSGTTNHSAIFADLSANSTYYYRITAIDASGNVSTVDGSFVTNANTPPIIGPVGGSSGGGGGGNVVIIKPQDQNPDQKVEQKPDANNNPANPQPNTPAAAFKNLGNAGVVIKNIQAPGKRNIDVKNIQKILNADKATQIAKSGPGSPGKETNLYGAATKAAVGKFQIKYGILKSPKDKGYGIVGPATRKKMNELLGKK